MAEYALALPAVRFSEGAVLVRQAVESIVQNTLDVSVVFLFRTPRVQIQGVRELRVEQDEDAAFVLAAQNISPSSN